MRAALQADETRIACATDATPFFAFLREARRARARRASSLQGEHNPALWPRGLKSLTRMAIPKWLIGKCDLVAAAGKKMSGRPEDLPPITKH